MRHALLLSLALPLITACSIKPLEPAEFTIACDAANPCPDGFACQGEGADAREPAPEQEAGAEEEWRCAHRSASPSCTLPGESRASHAP